VSFCDASGEFPSATRVRAGCLRPQPSRAPAARCAGSFQAQEPSSTTIHRRRGTRSPPHAPLRRARRGSSLESFDRTLVLGRPGIQLRSPMLFRRAAQPRRVPAVARRPPRLTTGAGLLHLYACDVGDHVASPPCELPRRIWSRRSPDGWASPYSSCQFHHLYVGVWG
jgi:hypothetical protein